MSFIQNSRIFYINSRNRISGTDGSFTFTIQIPLEEKYDRVCVLQAFIPKSYYLVAAPNNTFVLTEGTQSATITVPSGSYNVNSFIKVVLPLINAGSPNKWLYTMSFPNNFISPDTGLFTWGVSGNTSQPSFTFSVGLYEQFGFNTNSTNSFTSNSLTSSNVVNFIPESTVFIHSDIADGGDNDILQECYDNNGVTFSNITYLCTQVDAYSKKLRSAASNVYRFNFTDENGLQLDFNGQNNLTTIVVYKEDTIFSLIKNFIKLNLLHEPDNNLT